MSAEAYKNKGNEEFKKGNMQAAIENYTYAIEMDPKNYTYLTNRATAYASMKLWEKSLRDSEKSLTLNPDWTKGHYRKAIALFELGRLQEAVASFKIASSLDPTNEEIKKRYEEALHLWKKDQTPAQIAKEEGNELFKLGKIDAAIEAYTKAISLCTSEKDLATKAQCFNNRANCWVQKYEPNKVINDCTECLNIEPGNLKALLRRGFAYESLDKMRLALDDFNKVLSIDPSVTKAHQAAHRIKSALRALGKEV